MSFTDNQTALSLCDVILTAAKKNVLKKAVFSKSHDKSVTKVTTVPALIGGVAHIQAEYFHTDNKATHKNIPISHDSAPLILEMIGAFSQINVITTLGECEYRVSSKGKQVLLGGDKLARKLEGTDIQAPVRSTNNREKRYILDGSEPFLVRLGVSDANGRVYDKKQAKFRQINRFLELVRDVEDKLPHDEIRICDLCCGKSYLSFAVYHYFANVKKIKTQMTGIDLKSDVIEHCSAVARDVGFDGLEFICMDINDYVTDKKPSLVISLHACDVATDIVLHKAVEWKTDVILSTPCCHHELNHTIKCEALSFITDYSMLRQKLCDAATDALRLKRLESHGYSTCALELIDPEETPKNVMLRAIRKKNFNPESADARVAMKEYLDAKAFLCGENAQNVHF